MLILVLYSCKISSREEEIASTRYENRRDVFKRQMDSIKLLVKPGDIIFRGGTDIESDIIRSFSRKDNSFSHCGIMLITDSGLRVAHILGGRTNISGNILFQSVEDFFSYPNNEAAGLYTMNLTTLEVESAKLFVDSVDRDGISFDIKFNLFTKDKLYWTELLVDAISYAKKDTNLFSPVRFNLQNTKYRFLSNDGNHFLFYPIDEFQLNKYLLKKATFYFPNYNET